MRNDLNTEPDQAGATADNSSDTQPALSLEDFRTRVAKAAYFLAEQRGFEPGCEVEDWLTAEVIVRGQLNRAS